jgi:hypothetical protein
MLSQDRAIEIARDHVLSRREAGVLDERDVAAERAEGGWHVWFPWHDPDMLGGEPHVTVRDDGSIGDFYSTQ